MSSTESPAATAVTTAPERPVEPGTISVAIADVLGNDLPSRIVLYGSTEAPITLLVPQGKGEKQVPAGTYEAFIHVYQGGVPVLVAVKDLEVAAEDTAYLVYNLLEGASGSRPLRAFDQDFDLALDRVELAYGTDPADTSSIPGEDVLPFDPRALSDKAQWYRGELHARSNHGAGHESVGQLIRRAERSDLDFLAIADRNTMASIYDPDYRSNSVVLIPAMECGSDEKGVALIYGPRTMPRIVETQAEAQAEILKIQAQGGIVAIAHPCFSTAPWQWGLSYVNAVQVWCRDWRAIPPLWPDALRPALRERQDGELIHSIAFAAATYGKSANGQASVFWDEELRRGAKIAAIAGSLSSDPKVPLGRPLTYVFAREKSLPAILTGLRNGHTFLSSGPDGPLLYFGVDSNDDGRIDVNIGGVVPVGSDARFEVGVQRAKGMKMQVLRDGYPIITKEIEGDNFLHRFWLPVTGYSTFRVRIIDTPEDMEDGFGLVNVHAMTSPIYGQTIQMVDPENPDNNWIPLKPDPGNRGFQPDAPIPNDPTAYELIPRWRL